MKFEIVPIEELCGQRAMVYSVLFNDDELTAMDAFYDMYEGEFSKELDDIFDRLHVIGNKTGARDNFFKHNEGRDGDGVCALFDLPDSNLRLYCIRYGSVAVIIGGGGPKPGGGAYQKYPHLIEPTDQIKEVARRVNQRITDKELKWSADGRELLGNLKFEDNE